MWSYSLEGLGGGEEKEKGVFASEETYRLNQKAMSESHSHPIPQGPPSIPGGLGGAQDPNKALWKILLTEHILRVPGTFTVLGIRPACWEAN